MTFEILLCFVVGEDRANEATSRVISTLNKLYYQYKVIYFANMEADDNIPIANDMSIDSGEIDADSLFISGYMKLVRETDGVDNKTEDSSSQISLCEMVNNMEELETEILGAVKDLSSEEN
ncbi:hypothetical protein QYF36_011822 [Acer negundo]|nr:hypothetical protein QYF36_011822 [Acer negundo]